MTETAPPTVVGRYVLHAPIARGGMATIHLARLLGAEGFSRTVAAKRLHPQFTEDAEFLQMFLDEARIASKVHHPNVVPMLDVLQAGTEVILVQEYVHGVPLDKLVRAAHQQSQPLPVDVVVAIVSGMLAGLCAAHETRDEIGQPLGIVHRDVSPQNVLVGVDGVPRLLDFGVAKATLSTHVTRTGVFKGKLGYTSPELLRGVVTRATDIYASGVVLWEALAGRRPYVGLSEGELVSVVTSRGIPKLTDSIDRASVSSERWQLLGKLDEVVGKATAFAMEDRYETAVEMQEALLAIAPAAASTEIARWVKRLGKTYLEGREKVIASEESSWRRQLGRPVAAAAAGSAGEELSVPAAASQPSTTLRVSVLSVPPPRRGRVQWPILGMLLLIGALLAGILLVLWRRPMALPVVPGPSAVPGPSVVPEAVATPSALVAPSPEPDITASAPTPTVSPAVSADSSARSTARATVRLPAIVRAATAAPRAAAPAAPAKECDPPFYFDGKKKVFKPGCL